MGWRLAGLAVYGFRHHMFATLIAVAVFLAVVQGWFVDWDGTASYPPPTTEQPAEAGR